MWRSCCGIPIDPSARVRKTYRSSPHAENLSPPHAENLLLPPRMPKTYRSLPRLRGRDREGVCYRCISGCTSGRAAANSGMDSR